MFIRYTAFHFQQLGNKKQKDKENAKDDNKITEILTDKSDQIDNASHKLGDVNSNENLSSKSNKCDSKNKPKSNSCDESSQIDASDSCKNGHIPAQSKKNKKDKVEPEKKTEVEDTNSEVHEAKEEEKESLDIISSKLLAEAPENEVDTDEGKKIVESLIDSISNGDKQDSKCGFLKICI